MKWKKLERGEKKSRERNQIKIFHDDERERERLTLASFRLDLTSQRFDEFQITIAQTQIFSKLLSIFQNDLSRHFDIISYPYFNIIFFVDSF